MADDRAKLTDLMEDMPIGMLTTFGASGVRSIPMARQEIEPAFGDVAELWFITGRSTDHTHAILADSRVALTFSSRDAWVALRGTAEVVDDEARLSELWNTFAEAWLPGGPENPEAVLLRVSVEQGEYWDTPGGKVASLISFAKTRLTGETYDTDHGTVST